MSPLTTSGRWMQAWVRAAAFCAVLGHLPAVLHAQPTYAAPVGPRIEQQPFMRIGLIADAQYCDCDPEVGRFYRISMEKLDQAIDTLNAHRVDWVVNLGDLIDRQLGSYARPMDALKQLDMPVYHVLGNHEFWDVPFRKQRTVLDTLGLGQGYCALELPGWRMLFLDGTELAEYAQGAHPDVVKEAEACRGSLDGYANKALWNGAIGQQQMAWIDAQLSEADLAGERALLFCHFPISPPGHPMTLWNEADLRVLIERHPSAEAWLAGHAHGGSYVQLGGVHHLTLRGMLMTPDSNSFAILNVFSDRLVVEGFGREPARVLPLRGSQVVPATLLPPVAEAPDALPPAPQYCTERTVVRPLGAAPYSEETDPNSSPDPSQIPPGIYEILDRSATGFDCRRWVVLPRE